MLPSRIRHSKIPIVLAVLILSTLACAGFERTYCTFLNGGEWVYYPGTNLGGCCKTTTNDCSGAYQPETQGTSGSETSPAEKPPTQVTPPQAATSPSMAGVHQFTLTSCTVTEYADTNCTCGDTDGVIEIFDNEVTMQFVGRGKFTFSKQDSDSYTHSNHYGVSSLAISTLTLNENGFLHMTEVYDTSDNTHICTYHKIGTYTK
jgi:hypothetical protein